MTNDRRFSIIVKSFKRGWRNWQTRTFEGRVGNHTGSSPVLRTNRRKTAVERSFFVHVLFCARLKFRGENTPLGAPRSVAFAHCVRSAEGRRARLRRARKQPYGFKSRPSHQQKKDRSRAVFFLCASYFVRVLSFAAKILRSARLAPWRSLTVFARLRADAHV